MRLHFSTDVMPRRMARKLQRAAQESGVSMRLRIAQLQIARMFGYRNYQELRVIIGMGASSDIVVRSADEYFRAAVARLATDNGWTTEFAERLCEPIKRLVELVVEDPLPAASRPKAPTRPAIVVHLKGRNSSRRSSRPQVTVFDLGTDDQGAGNETRS